MNLGYHCDLIREAMLYFGFKDDNKNEAIKLVQIANIYTDMFQKSELEWIYDNDFVSSANARCDLVHYDALPDKKAIKSYTDHLIATTYAAIKNTNGDIPSILITTGITIHIIQDLYAHSNLIELGIDQALNIKDPTYFDIVEVDNNGNFKFEKLQSVVNNYKNIDIYGPEFKTNDLHTTGNNTCNDSGCPKNDECSKSRKSRYYRPKHDNVDNYDERHKHNFGMNKDHGGRPYFEWVYRSGFKASLQWIYLIKNWVKDIYGDEKWVQLKEFWDTDLGICTCSTTNNLCGRSNQNCTHHKIPGANNNFPTINGKCNSEENATNCPRYIGISGVYNKLFEMMQAAGTWKSIKSLRLIGTDSLLNLFNQGIPFRAEQWKDLLYIITEYLFTFDSEYKHAPEGNCRRFESAIEDKRQNLRQEYFNNSEQEYNNLLAESYRTLKRYKAPSYRWLKIRYLECRAQSKWEANNDLYIKTTVNGLMYREAEYLDEDNPFPSWIVLSPITEDTAQIKVELWEDDDYDDHDHMDIVDSGTNLYASYNFENDELTISPSRVNPKHIVKTAMGWMVQAKGDKDLVLLNIGEPSDKRVEVVTRTYSKRNSETDDTIWANIGAYVFKLDKPEYDDHERDEGGVGLDIFTFDPGKYFTRDNINRFLLYKEPDGDMWKFDYAGVKSNDIAYLSKTSEKTLKIEGSLEWVSKFSQGEYLQYPTDEQLKDYIKNFSIIIKTSSEAYAGTNRPVYINILNRNKQQITRFVLDNFRRNDFRRRNLDFFSIVPKLDIPKARLNDIEYVEIDYGFGDKWIIDEFECWVNNKLFIQKHFKSGNRIHKKLIFTKTDRKEEFIVREKIKGYGLGFFRPLKKTKDKYIKLYWNSENIE